VDHPYPSLTVTPAPARLLPHAPRNMRSLSPSVRVVNDRKRCLC
jgi:hypothetical protein